jgi:hypothetical protein
LIEAVDALLRTAISRRNALSKYASDMVKWKADQAKQARKVERAAKVKAEPKPKKAREPKSTAVLPPVGGTLTRNYKDTDYVVTVLESGFELNGETYTSLSAAAAAITGRKCSGTAFFGLAK